MLHAILQTSFSISVKVCREKKENSRNCLLLPKTQIWIIHCNGGKRTICGLEDNIKTKLAYKEYEGMDAQWLVTTNSYIANKNKEFL
jgi:hypothetical protein